jgi:O-antigen ligase
MSPADAAAPNRVAPFPAVRSRRSLARARSATVLRLADGLLTIGVFLAGHAVLKIGGLNFTVSDLFLFAAAALYLGQRRFNLAPFGAMTPIWLLGLSTMLGGLFVSSAIYGDLLRWLDIGIQYSAAYYLVPVLLMAVDRQFARRLVVAYIFGIVISEIIGILSYFLLTPDQTLWLSTGFIAPNYRIGAMAGEPNPNGATVAFALAMLLYASRKRLLTARVTIPCALILVWGLLLSASVTGAVAAFVCLCASLAITGLTRLLKIGLVVVIAAGLYLASGVPLPQIFQKRVADAIVDQDVTQAGTFNGRYDLIKEAWGQTDEHVLLGMGADEYRDWSKSGQPVHNLHLLIWDEGGGPAYAGFVLMLALLGIFALAAIRDKREEAAMALAVVIVFYIYTMSLPHLYSRFWTVPIFLALSTIYGRATVPTAAVTSGGPSRAMRSLSAQ